MMYSQYCRIETKAGGVRCTDRAFVRACHTKLRASGKTREKRTIRHEWIREGLAIHHNEQDFVRKHRL